eukprot:TRINITY_DN2040_c0_g1_i1.p1 TRINITY_DN2040_c0_g1~~TRINITY_DN2040_c0_g1_i1.p1  ORF type:complete len:1130 (+),score=230.29 TRINITY_DN2040_c0_g1_i1:79-3468(+)
MMNRPVLAAVLLAAPCGACEVNRLMVPRGAVLSGDGCLLGETVNAGDECAVTRPGYRCTSFTCLGTGWASAASSCLPNKCGGGALNNAAVAEWADGGAACDSLSSGMYCDSYCKPGFRSTRFPLLCEGNATHGAYDASRGACTANACTKISGTVPDRTAGDAPFAACLGLRSGAACSGYACEARTYATPPSFALVCNDAGAFDVSRAYECDANPGSCSLGPSAGSLPAGMTAAQFAACNAMQTGEECTAVSCPSGFSQRAPLRLQCTGGAYSAAGVECVSNALSCAQGVDAASLAEGVDAASLAACDDRYSGDACPEAACLPGFAKNGVLFLSCTSGSKYSTSGLTCTGGTCAGGSVGDIPAGVDTSSLQACDALRSGETCDAVRCLDGAPPSGSLVMQCDGSSRYPVAGVSCGAPLCDPTTAPVIPSTSIDCTNALTEGTACSVASDGTGGAVSGSVTCKDGGYVPDVQVLGAACATPFAAPPLTNGAAACTGSTCSYTARQGYVCTGNVSCSGDAYAHTAACLPIACGTNEFVDGATCRPCATGETARAPSVPGGDTTCNPPGAWGLLVRTEAPVKLTASSFEFGHKDPNGAYAQRCQDIPDAVDVLRVVVGVAVDYAVPSAGKTICEALKGSALLFYSASPYGPFRTWEEHRSSRGYDKRAVAPTWLAAGSAVGGGCCGGTYRDASTATTGYGKRVEVFGRNSAGDTTTYMLRAEYRGAMDREAMVAVGGVITLGHAAIGREVNELGLLSLCPAAACPAHVCPDSASGRVAQDCLVRGSDVRPVPEDARRGAAALQFSMPATPSPPAVLPGDFPGTSYADLNVTVGKLAADSGQTDAQIANRILGQLRQNLKDPNGVLSRGQIVSVTTVPSYRDDVARDNLLRDDDDDFPTWAIVLIVVLVCLCCALVPQLIYRIVKRKEQEEEEEEKEPVAPPPGGGQDGSVDMSDATGLSDVEVAIEPAKEEQSGTGPSSPRSLQDDDAGTQHPTAPPTRSVPDPRRGSAVDVPPEVATPRLARPQPLTERSLYEATENSQRSLLGPRSEQPWQPPSAAVSMSTAGMSMSPPVHLPPTTNPILSTFSPPQRLGSVRTASLVRSPKTPGAHSNANSPAPAPAFDANDPRQGIFLS